MNRIKKVLVGVAALAALAFGGAQIAGATGSHSNESDGADQQDQPVTGATAKQASAAAIKAVGGGTVAGVEDSDEGGAAAYEVKVDRAGKVTEVTLGSDYSVVKTQLDDDRGQAADDGDAPDPGDGDGEDPND